MEELFNKMTEFKIDKNVKEQIIASYNIGWNKTFFKTLSEYNIKALVIRGFTIIWEKDCYIVSWRKIQMN